MLLPFAVGSETDLRWIVAQAYIIDSNQAGTVCVVRPRTGADDMDVV